MLTESKSILAKLLATENITVVQKPVRTAHFNLDRRELVVPVLDGKISPELYDTLVGHEVGHALDTPAEGWHDSIIDLKINRSILNVCEDIRIERRIKSRFPGIRASFVKGYRELVEKDFFGTLGADLNALNLVDRINLYTKIGVSTGIKFSAEELPLVDAAVAADAWEDTVAAAKAIQEYMRSKAEEQKKQPPSGNEEDGEFDDADLDFDQEDNGEFDGEGDSDSFDDGGEPSEEAEGEDGEDEEKSTSSYNNDPADLGSKFDRDIESKTDKVFREKQETLYDSKVGDVIYANIPDVDLDYVIVPYKEVLKEFKNIHSSAYLLVEDSSLDKLEADYNKFRQSSTKVVSYLIKEFELRKNADQYKRSSIAKTGELDLNRLASYRLTDDIFKKVTVVPGGKSHGLVMYMDFSGSMKYHFHDTIKQLLNLAFFCRKASIPFDVYAFTDQWHQKVDEDKFNLENEKAKVGSVYFNYFTSLLQILSSKMTAAEFNYTAKMLFGLQALSGKSRRDYYAYYIPPHKLGLGNTPLNDSIIAAMKMVPEFKKNYRVQVVNTIFLTDGASSNLRGVKHVVERAAINGGVGTEKWLYGYERTHDEHGKRLVGRTYLVDPVTGDSQQVYNRDHSETNALLNLLKSRTGCNIVGFFLLPSSGVREAIRDFFPRAANMDSVMSQLKKNKYDIVTSQGYDELYLIKADSMDTEGDAEGLQIGANASRRQLISAFKNFNSGKIQNRVILNRFIGMIA